MTHRPTLESVMAAALDARAEQIRTAMPAEVVTVNAETVDVRPTVWTDEGEAPVVPSVPIAWPRVGLGYLVLPITHGDTGLLLCCESDLAEWRRTGEAGVPADTARHHLQNAVFVPGLATAACDLTIPVNNVILAATNDLLLGGPTANKRVVHDELLTQLWWLLGYLSVWVGQVDASPAGPFGGTVNLQTRCNTIQAGIMANDYEADRVKVED